MTYKTKIIPINTYKNARKNNMFFYVTLTILGVVFLLFAFTLHTKGKEARENQLYEAACHAKEQLYVQNVKDYLNNCGFENVGVTMNRIVDSDQSRSYTLYIYHRKINRLSMEELCSLKSKLLELSELLPESTLKIVTQ